MRISGSVDLTKNGRCNLGYGVYREEVSSVLVTTADAKRLLSSLRSRATRARGGLNRIIERSKSKRPSQQTLLALEREISDVALQMSNIVRIMDDLEG